MDPEDPEVERVWREEAVAAGDSTVAQRAALGPLWRRGRQAWGFEVAVTPFARHVAAACVHASEPGATADAAALPIEDLYLVVGVVERRPEAIARFRSRFAPELSRVLGRLVPTREHDDLRQRLEAHLLVGTDERGPALRKYRGRGALTSWVRAVGTHFVVDALRAQARQPETAAWHSRADSQVPSELERRIASHGYAAVVREAMDAAFGALTIRERNLVRYSVFHDLGVDELGALYGVHRSTAARWLARARASLARHVEQHFARHVRAPADEAASLLRNLHGQLDVSIRSFLASTVEAEPDDEDPSEESPGA